MFKKILSFLLITLFGLTLTSCSNDYGIKNYKNNVSYSAFSGWKSEFTSLSLNRDYEMSYSGEIHKKAKTYLDTKEMKNYQYDVVMSENVKMDIENKLAVTKGESNEVSKNITRYGKEEKKKKADKDYSYQTDNTILYELDDNNKIYGIVLKSFSELADTYLSIPFIVEYLTECNTYYVDNNVYTAVLDSDTKKIVCQITVNKDNLILVSQYESKFEVNLTSGEVVKEEVNYKHSYKFTFKDVDLKAKDLDKYIKK